MLVLKIIGGIILFLVLVALIAKFHSWVEQKYRFDFFNETLFGTSFISYLLLYFGHKWYLDAIKDNGDHLNGTFLMWFGAMGILFIIYKNIKGTNFFVGLLVTCIQLPLFAIGSFYGAIMVLGVLAALGSAKPVYNINQD